jgi:prepilin-type N-terminal cleavage/methylation domain-containing protein
MKPSKTSAFTLTELLVVIAVVVILVGIFIPAFTTVTTKCGRDTASLSNVKSIFLACKLYASDNDGAYPTNQLDPKTFQPSKTLGPITDYSNTAFAQLFPDYLTNETIFAEQRSAFTPMPPDNVIDKPQVAPPVETLKANENTFAYCIGLKDTSNALFPLVADGFADVNHWTYVTNKLAKGGVWEGKKAIVGLVDGSATIMKVNSRTMTVMGNPVSSTSSYFSTAGVATPAGEKWLASPANHWLNPR